MTPNRLPDKPSLAAALLSTAQFEQLRDLLAADIGVYLDPTQQRLLETSVRQRMELLGDDLAGYERRLHAPAGRSERRRLAELVLNHETVFFRNQPHLRALRSDLLPELNRSKPRGQPIRIWSAGCATGEEAYSLAITALETFGSPALRPIEIIATDLSEPALEKARRGFYRGRVLQNLAPELLERYFIPQNDGYLVGPALRKLVRFETLNLLDPFPAYINGIDIIFCQNVTIYFQLKTCHQLIARFYELLPIGGLLCLGFSETLWRIFDRFHSREVAGTYVYYKGASESRAPAGVAAQLRNIPLANQPAPPPDRHTRTTHFRVKQPARVTLKPIERFHEYTDHVQVAGRAEAAALAQGRELLQNGDSSAALAVLRAISPQSAFAPQVLMLIARAHADRGDLDLAAAEVQRAIEIDTLNHDAYLLLGIIHGRHGNWPAAIAQLERARYLNAESALIAFYLAEAYRQSGKHQKAAREYQNTLRKLDVHPPGALLDGVAVSWLRETCQRQIAYSSQPI